MEKSLVWFLIQPFTKFVDALSITVNSIMTNVVLEHFQYSKNRTIVTYLLLYQNHKENVDSLLSNETFFFKITQGQAIIQLSIIKCFTQRDIFEILSYQTIMINQRSDLN